MQFYLYYFFGAGSFPQKLIKKPASETKYNTTIYILSYQVVMEYKNINIGELIKKRVQYLGINSDRICSFMKINEKEIEEMYHHNNIDTDVLLKWSKLLEYDFSGCIAST